MFWYLRYHKPVDFKLLGLFKDQISELPYLVQAFLAAFVFDVFYYWFHRLSHVWQPLWFLHATHQSSEQIHALSGYRLHVLGGLILRILSGVVLGVIGFDFKSVSVLSAMYAFSDAFIHMDTRLRFGFLEKITVTPHFHLWHHAKYMDHKNMAILFPVIDMIFGTYHMPDNTPSELGLREEKIKNTIFEHQFYPLIWLIRNFKKSN